MSTPDTSPGDELDEILFGYEQDVCERLGQATSDIVGYKPPKAVDFDEAKDRLNRLMLTREAAVLRKMQADIKKLPSVDSAGWWKSRQDIDRLFDTAIDAQLNKEETDGDVPTHSEPSKP